MIEGINATIASTALVRPLVDQAERSSYAANPEQVQRVPQAPYLSLYIAMNYTIDKAVLQIRDSESAEVISQIPSDTQIRAYRKAAAQQPVIFEPRADAAEERQAVVTPSVAAAPAPDVDVPEATDGADAPESAPVTSVAVTA